MHFGRAAKKHIFYANRFLYILQKKSRNKLLYVWNLMIHIVCVECFSLRWIIKIIFLGRRSQSPAPVACYHIPEHYHCTLWVGLPTPKGQNSPPSMNYLINPLYHDFIKVVKIVIGVIFQDRCEINNMSNANKEPNFHQ